MRERAGKQREEGGRVRLFTGMEQWDLSKRRLVFSGGMQIGTCKSGQEQESPVDNHHEFSEDKMRSEMGSEEEISWRNKKKKRKPNH